MKEYQTEDMELSSIDGERDVKYEIIEDQSERDRNYNKEMVLIDLCQVSY